jgi:hypothetical protein
MDLIGEILLIKKVGSIKDTKQIIKVNKSTRITCHHTISTLAFEIK